MATSGQNESLNKERVARGAGLWNRGISAMEWWFGDVWCGVLITFMTLFICTEILARLLVGYSFMGLVDIVSLCLIMLTYASLAAVQRDDAHIKIGLIREKLLGKLSGYILEIVNLVLGIVVAGFLFYVVTMVVITLYRAGTITSTIFWPSWPAALFMPIGCMLYVIRMGLQLRQPISKIRELRKPQLRFG